MAITYCYIRAAGIRKLAKDNGKRCSTAFLDELNRFIYDAVCRAVKIFNGHRKTLDGTVAKVALKEFKI